MNITSKQNRLFLAKKFALWLLFLGLFMLATSPALASSNTGDFVVQGGTLDIDYSYTQTLTPNNEKIQTLTILKETKLTIKNVDPNQASYDHQISIPSGITANIILDGINIDLSDTGSSTTAGAAPIEILGNGIANITLGAGSNNHLKGGLFMPALMAQDDASGLTGTISIDGEGALEAESGYRSAAIGSAFMHDGGIITIKSGNITLSGQTGIGAGDSYNNIGGKSGIISIEGGNITATTQSGVAIGGGYDASVEKITISGGTVIATSNNLSAAIGAANGTYNNNNTSGEIIISGGNITAINTHDYGAGIGGGNNASGGTTIITGGIINAQGGRQAAAIGGGNNGAGGNIIISGGIVYANGGLRAAGIGNGYPSTDTGSFITNYNGNPGNAFISASSIADITSQASWSGIIIDGDDGQFYGINSYLATSPITLYPNKNLVIADGNTFTIEQGAILINNGTITVEAGASLINSNGKIINNGFINNLESSTFTNNQVIENNGTIASPPTGTGSIHTPPNNVNNPQFDISIASIYMRMHETTLQYATSNTDNTTWFTYTGQITFSGISTFNNINVVSGNHNIILKDTDIKGIVNTPALLINPNATASIELQNENILQGGDYAAGLQVPTGASLVINGNGSLNAIGGYFSAGIGGANNSSSGSITINGGTITATTFNQAAGIGGGNMGDADTITITGGNITAIGGSHASAIGNGLNSSTTNANIIISGGNIIATNTNNTKGISGNFSTGVNGTAQILATDITDTSGSWSGTIINGLSGQVYGNQTLNADFEIPENVNFTIPEGSLLTIPSGITLSNRGIIDADSLTRINNNGIFNNYTTIYQARVDAAKLAIEGHVFTPLPTNITTQNATNDALIEQINNIPGIDLMDIILKIDDVNTFEEGQPYTFTVNISTENPTIEANSMQFTVAFGNSIGEAIINVDSSTLIYNGYPQTKNITSVMLGGTALEAGVDYTVSNNTQTNAGNYELTITGINKYFGTKTAAYTIEVADYAAFTDFTAFAKIGTSGKVDLSNFAALANSTFEDMASWDITSTNPAGAAAVLVDNSYNIDIDNHLVYTIKNDPALVNNTVTFAINITSTNYNPFDIIITINITDKDVPTIAPIPITHIYNGQAAPNTLIEGTANVNGENILGEWQFVAGQNLKNVADSGIKNVIFKPQDATKYTEVIGTVLLTIDKKPLTIELKLDKDSLYVGETLPIAQLSFGDIVAGDNLVPATNLIVNNNYPNNNTAGNFKITWENAATMQAEINALAAAANYNINYINFAEFTIISLPTGSGGGGGGGSHSSINKINSGQKISLNTLKAILEDNDDLQVNGANDMVAIFDTAAIEAIIKAAGADALNLEIIIEEADMALLTEQQKAVIGNRPAFKLQVLVDGELISDFDDGQISISLPYQLKDGESADNLIIYFLDDEGNIVEKIGTEYDADKQELSFKLSHFSIYMLAYEQATELQNPFTDISADSWYYDAVLYVYANQIMSGTDKTLFEPQLPATRAMIWTVLARIDGVDTEGGTMWYSKAMDWAIAENISDGSNPHGNISREQLITMLYRYEQSKGGGFSGSFAFPLNFTDAEDVSDWAWEAMLYMTMVEVITGLDDGSLNPQGQATRAEIAAILMRYMELE